MDLSNHGVVRIRQDFRWVFYHARRRQVRWGRLSYSLESVSGTGFPMGIERFAGDVHP